MDTFTIYLSFEAHRMSKQQVEGIKHPEKTRQIYLNTLAIYATNFYLKCLHFDTDVSKSEHQDWLKRSLFDIADLEVKGVGRIECRPLLPNSHVMRIPVETWENRIAYLAVEIDEDLKAARILGFTKTPQEEISVNNLDSFDNFLDYLCELETQEIEIITNLGEWLKGIIDEGWQRVEQVLNPSQLELARAREFNISRGRKIDLLFPLKTVQVALITKLTAESETEEEIDLLVELHPVEELYLPEGIILGVEDNTGEIVLQAQARDQENWIQLAFSAEFAEEFNVVIILDDCQVKQAFIV